MPTMHRPSQLDDPPPGDARWRGHVICVHGKLNPSTRDRTHINAEVSGRGVQSGELSVLLKRLFAAGGRVSSENIWELGDSARGVTQLRNLRDTSEGSI
jgi:hypothetical protein